MRIRPQPKYLPLLRLFHLPWRSLNPVGLLEDQISPFARESNFKESSLFHSSPWDPLKHLLGFNLNLIFFTAYPDFLHFLTDCALKALFDKNPSCKSPLQSLFLGNNDRTLFSLVFSKLFYNNSLLFLFSFIVNNSSLFDFTICILVSD